MTDQPYQVMPPLTTEEYEALRDDIEARGILVPIDVDELGQVIDGHHRQQIATDLGIPCPARVVAGLTEEEKRHHAMALNVARRHLTQAQRRELVVAELNLDPSRSDRAIARIVGVDGKTVGAVRRSLCAESPHAGAEVFTDEHVAEAQHRTERIRDGLATIDDTTAELVAAGLALDAVRFLTTGMDDLLSWNDDPDWRAGIRTIFEPRIRAVLGGVA